MKMNALACLFFACFLFPSFVLLSFFFVHLIVRPRMVNKNTRSHKKENSNEFIEKLTKATWGKIKFIWECKKGRKRVRDKWNKASDKWYEKRQIYCRCTMHDDHVCALCGMHCVHVLIWVKINFIRTIKTYSFFLFSLVWFSLLSMRPSTSSAVLFQVHFFRSISNRFWCFCRHDRRFNSMCSLCCAAWRIFIVLCRCQNMRKIENNLTCT